METKFVSAPTRSTPIPTATASRTALRSSSASTPWSPDATTTVTGHVTQANGSPFPGSAVTVLTYFAATTDQTGAFLIAHVPVTLGSLVVAARAVVSGSVLAGSSTATAPVGGGTTDVGTIQLGQSAGQVSGVVTNAANQPVSGAAVTVVGGSDTRTTTTDATGAYAVVGLQAGIVSVTVFDPNTSLRGLNSGVLSGSGTGLALNVKLAAYGTVSGTVLNTAGVAVGAGATVNISGSLGAATTTDALGRFSFSFVPLGSITVNASDSIGNRGQSAATVTATSQTINLNVQYIARGTVTGTVYDSTHTAVAGLPVTLTNYGTFSQSLTATTNSLGKYTFTAIYAGTIYVSSQNAANNTAGTLAGRCLQRWPDRQCRHHADRRRQSQRHCLPRRRHDHCARSHCHPQRQRLHHHH